MTNQQAQQSQLTMIQQINAEADQAEASNAKEQLDRIKDSAPSISTGAMLVLLTIKVPEMRRQDKQASDEVAHSKNAKAKMVTVYKSLFDSDALNAIKRLRGVARNHVHYRLTQPWSDSGLRMLTTKAYFRYEPEMSELDQEFWRLVNVFLNDYDIEIAKVQVELGDMFDPLEYPSKEEVAAKFAFSYDIIPMPMSGDFRLDIANEAKEHLTEQYDQFYADQFQGAMRHVWEKLMQPLANMVDRLDYGDGDTKRIFNASLVDNVLEFVDVMEMVNVTGDPDMQRVQKDLANALRGVTAEALRDDSYLRSVTQRAAAKALKDTKAVLDSIPSLMD